MEIKTFTDAKSLAVALTDLLKKGVTFEAQEEIMDLRDMIIGLRNEIRILKEENEKLSAALNTKAALKHDGNLFWKEKEDGQKDGPFCPTCTQKDNLQVLMSRGDHDYKCPVCNYKHEHTARLVGIVRRRGGWMGA